MTTGRLCTQLGIASQKLFSTYPSTVHVPFTLTTFWSCHRKFISRDGAILGSPSDVCTGLTIEKGYEDAAHFIPLQRSPLSWSLTQLLVGDDEFAQGIFRRGPRCFFIRSQTSNSHCVLPNAVFLPNLVHWLCTQHSSSLGRTYSHWLVFK